MKTQMMTISNSELTLASYALSRCNNKVVGALQLAKCTELLSRLRTGIVHGFFVKADNSIREFYCTATPSLVAKKTVLPMGSDPKLLKGQIPMWDCEHGKWISLRIGSFIGFAD